jgi:hypothetical protein
MTNIVPAYYVSPTGSDSNAGTLNAPFATLQKAQQAMQNSDIKTTYILAGTYAMSTALTLTSADNGETWTGYPGNPAQSAILQYSGSNHREIVIDGASNITISNLNFDGGTSGGGDGDGNNVAGAVYVAGTSNNIYVENNLFTNNFNQSDLYIFNSDNIYYEGNTSIGSYEPVSGHVTDGSVDTGWFVTDNTISEFVRIGIELQVDTAGSGLGDVNIDYNVISNFATSILPIAISFIPGTGNTGDTVWGNTITGTPGAGEWGVEFGGPTDVEHNTMDGVDAPFVISAATGATIQNNALSNFGMNPPYNSYAFNVDGGFNDGQWVGVNTLNGIATAGWIGYPNQGPQPPSTSPPSPPPPPTTITAAQINMVYSDVLGRTASAAEQAAWVAAQSSGMVSASQVIAAIVNSPEAQDYSWDVVRLYQAAFGRVPDPAGFTADVDFLDPAMYGPGMVLQLAQAFVASAEFQSDYGTPTTTATLTTFIEAVYQNVLGRTGSIAEVNAWLATGESAAQILIGFSNSAEFQADANPAVMSLLTINALAETITTGGLFQTAITGASSGQTSAAARSTVTSSIGTGGTLSVSDGTQTANLALLGQYAAAGFATAPGQGHGTSVAQMGQTDTTAPNLLTIPHH